MEVHVSMYDRTPYCVTSHSHEMMCFGCITPDGQQRWIVCFYRNFGLILYSILKTLDFWLQGVAFGHLTHLLSTNWDESTTFIGPTLHDPTSIIFFNWNNTIDIVFSFEYKEWRLWITTKIHLSRSSYWMELKLMSPTPSKLFQSSFIYLNSKNEKVSGGQVISALGFGLTAILVTSSTFRMRVLFMKSCEEHSDSECS